MILMHDASTFPLPESSTEEGQSMYGVNFSPLLDSAVNTSVAQVIKKSASGLFIFPASVNFSKNTVKPGTNPPGWPPAQADPGSKGEQGK
jgi:hypothetical protein